MSKGIGDRYGKAIGEAVGSYDGALGEMQRACATLSTCCSACQITYFANQKDQEGSQRLWWQGKVRDHVPRDRVTEDDTERGDRAELEDTAVGGQSKTRLSRECNIRKVPISLSCLGSLP